MEASAVGEFEEEGEGKEGALLKKNPSGALYEVSSEWLTGRPGQSCQIPKQRERYVAKKMARESRRLCLIPSEYSGLLRFARFTKFGSR